MFQKCFPLEYCDALLPFETFPIYFLWQKEGWRSPQTPSRKIQTKRNTWDGLPPHEDGCCSGTRLFSQSA